MNSFLTQATAYVNDYQSPTTRYTLHVGIIFIILSSMILLSFIRIIVVDIFNVSLAGILTLATLLYYFRLNWRFALILTPIFIVLLWVAALIAHQGPTKFALWSFIIIFCLGALLQVIGYFIEGKKPQFRVMLKQLLFAPLIAVADIFFMAGRMQLLKEKIYASQTEKLLDKT